MSERMTTKHTRATFTRVTLKVMLHRKPRLRRRVLVLLNGQHTRSLAHTFLVLLLSAAAITYALALWKVPDLIHVRAPQDRYNARLLVVSIGGAVVVGVGLLYTGRNYRLSHRGQVTDRFAKALERLDSDQPYIRIGGVYAMAHVMRDSPNHHDDVVEVLHAFIRHHAPRNITTSDRPSLAHSDNTMETLSTPAPPVPAPDIQTAITALAHRPPRPERRKINLANLHLAAADLQDAQLNSSNLQRANLTGANLKHADLSNADLAHAILRRTRNLCATDLEGAHLTGANLEGADLTGANLARTDLTGANLKYADLSNANLAGADLSCANLWCATLHSAILFGANLAGANLVGADLTAVMSLRGAIFADANLQHTTLTSTHILGADLRDARNLTRAQLAAATKTPPPGPL